MELPPFTTGPSPRRRPSAIAAARRPARASLPSRSPRPPGDEDHRPRRPAGHHLLQGRRRRLGGQAQHEEVHPPRQGGDAGHRPAPVDLGHPRLHHRHRLGREPGAQDVAQDDPARVHPLRHPGHGDRAGMEQAVHLADGTRRSRRPGSAPRRARASRATGPAGVSTRGFTSRSTTSAGKPGRPAATRLTRAARSAGGHRRRRRPAARRSAPPPPGAAAGGPGPAGRDGAAPPEAAPGASHSACTPAQAEQQHRPELGGAPHPEQQLAAGPGRRAPRTRPPASPAPRRRRSPRPCRRWPPPPRPASRGTTRTPPRSVLWATAGASTLTTTRSPGRPSREGTGPPGGTTRWAGTPIPSDSARA